MTQYSLTYYDSASGDWNDITLEVTDEIEDNRLPAHVMQTFDQFMHDEQWVEDGDHITYVDGKRFDNGTVVAIGTHNETETICLMGVPSED